MPLNRRLTATSKMCFLLISVFNHSENQYTMVTHLHNIAQITYTPEAAPDGNKGYLHFIFATETDLQESLEFLNSLREKDLMFHVTMTGEKVLAEIYESGKKISDTGYANCDRTTMFKYKSEKRYKADSLMGIGFLNHEKIVVAGIDVFEPIKYTLETMTAM